MLNKEEIVREIKAKAFVDNDMIEGRIAAIYPVVKYEWGIERSLDKVTLLMPDITL